MRSLLLLAATLTLVGCASTTSVQDAQKATYYGAQQQNHGTDRPEWVVCTNCRTPTPKTLAVMPSVSLPQRQPVPPAPVAKGAEKHRYEVRFAFDSARLSPAARAKLKRIGYELQGADHIEVLGRTDAIGGKHYNDKLARRRARAVVAYFKKHGVNASLRVEGRGKCCYAAPNDSARHRRLNRRTIVIVVG